MSAPDPAMLRVCIVEDEARLRELLVREVAAMGHTSIGCPSAEQAWPEVEAGVDVVLLDLNLPGMSGMDMLTRIRAEQLDVAVVILTGFGGFETAVESLRNRAEDYLTKPCSLADIDRVLARVLERKRTAEREQAFAESARRVAEAEPAIRLPVDVDGERSARTVEEVERDHILAVLHAHDMDKPAAAAELGISLRTLYNKIHAYRQQGFIN
ncbi:MAG TPA: response regulator [Phycisphaerae bacterium]|nr:response regulator [Phycisphaerales bacterium]HRX84253.1 response regulator [Phycisphaerae bacterium]